MGHTQLSSTAANALSKPSTEREGVDITLASGAATVSEDWSMGGWRLQFVRLGGNQSLGLDQTEGRIFVKVVTGELANINRGAFASARKIRNTLVETDAVTAGDAGAVFAVFTETQQAGPNVASMDEITMQGPNAEAFQWQTFEAKFGGFTDIFNGDDAYMSGGFHLLDDDGTEITYVNLWTAGKGVNLSTHNHGGEPSPVSPAFAEVHWVFNNGTGSGGMYGAAGPEAPHSDDYPMQRGDEHGYFFIADPSTGKPSMCDNGAVEYPWHGWEAGVDDKPGQAYDVVAAFETNPDYVLIS